MSTVQRPAEAIPSRRDDKPPSPPPTTALHTPPRSRSPSPPRPTDPRPPIAQHPANAAASPAPNARQISTPVSSRPSSPQPSAAQSQPTPESESDGDDDESSTDDIIDMDTFSQLIELDEDDPDFSKEMAWQYFSQAETTFQDLETALSAKDLPKLSSLGHYFKGSSAALGVARVQLSCEKIQHYGQLRDEDADEDLDEEEALRLIAKTLVRVKKEYREAEKWLKDYYKEDD